jgi:hypothetical protein
MLQYMFSHTIGERRMTTGLDAFADWLSGKLAARIKETAQ